MVDSMRTAKVCILLALTLILLSAAGPVAAANIYVDYTCILREALHAANKDQEEQECEAGSGDDTIILTRDDKPRSGELPGIDDDLVIDGKHFTIVADRNDPAFRVKDAHLTIRDIKIEFEGTRKGAAFEVTDGKLTLINVVVENCERGVKQKNGHVTIQGNSNICGLSADEVVEGTGTTDISLPVPPAPQTCGELSAAVATVSGTYGLASGVQCRQLDGAGIGVQSIVDAGFITAVDVWGYVEQGVEICFPQLGSIIFLDAASSPRAVSAIAAYRRGNSTCARLTRAGTVVLRPGEPPSASQPSVSEPAAGQAAASQATGDGCPIHTTGHLRLRAAASLQGEIIGHVPRGSNLNAHASTTYWYQVSYRGLTGWIGHKYVMANC